MSDAANTQSIKIGGAAVPLSSVQINKADPDDTKEFQVCFISPDIKRAPVLQAKKYTEMVKDLASTFREWSSGGIRIWFHTVSGTAGDNQLATFLADEARTGDNYIVATQNDAIIDFPGEVFTAIVGVHEELANDDTSGSTTEGSADDNVSQGES